MKNLFLTMVLVLAGVVGINAQTTNNTEFYAGYQFVRTNVETKVPTPSNFKFNRETDSHGFNVSATNYLSNDSAVGLTGEFGANFDGNGRNLYTTMGGITVKANRKGKVQPFVRGLGGIYASQHQGFNSDEAKVNFAYALGGGVDYKFKKLGWRIVQVDYLATRNSGQFDNNVRLSTGVVW